MHMLGKGNLVRKVSRIDGIVYIVVNPVVPRRHHVPDLVQQGLRLAPFEIILRFLMQEHGQNRNPGAQ